MTKLATFIIGMLCGAAALVGVTYALYTSIAPAYSPTQVAAECANSSHANWKPLCATAYRVGVKSGRQGYITRWRATKMAESRAVVAIHSPAAQKLWQGDMEAKLWEARRKGLLAGMKAMEAIYEATTVSDVPAGASALCNDGSYSYSVHHQGTCSWHNGVAEFYN